MRSSCTTALAKNNFDCAAHTFKDVDHAAPCVGCSVVRVSQSIAAGRSTIYSKWFRLVTAMPKAQAHLGACSRCPHCHWMLFAPLWWKPS